MCVVISGQGVRLQNIGILLNLRGDVHIVQLHLPDAETEDKNLSSRIPFCSEATAGLKNISF